MRVGAPLKKAPSVKSVKAAVGPKVKSVRGSVAMSMAPGGGQRLQIVFSMFVYILYMNIFLEPNNIMN